MFKKYGIPAIFAAVFSAAAVSFLLPMGAGIINIGNCSGALFSAILAVISAFFGKIRALCAKLCENKLGKICVYGFLAVSGIGVLTALGVSAAMIAAIADKPGDNETTLVVLGCQVKPSGPSLMLRRRLDTAYEYLAEHEDAKVVVSGGKGDDEIESEASAMRKYLINKGISEDRIFTEDKSTSTEENLAFSKKLISENGLCPKITLVTDGYHQLRADMIAKKMGLDAYNLAAPTALWLLPTYWLREIYGVLYYAVFGLK